MNPFALLRRKRSAEQQATQGLLGDLQALLPFYATHQHLALHEDIRRYPRVTSLVANGLGAYLLNVHLDVKTLTKIELLVEQREFHQSQQTGAFLTFSQSSLEGEAVSLQRDALGDGVALLLVSNSIQLLQSLPDLAPLAPWEVFPEVDADGLGSLQGSLDHWWRNYWWPYWLSLDQQQREQWLDDTRHPEGWREYVRLQDELNGTNGDPQA